MPSSTKPSTLELSEVRDHHEKRIKSPTTPFHQKFAIENIPEKGNCRYEVDFNTITSEFPLPQDSPKTDKNMNYFYGNETKHFAYNRDQSKIPRKCFEFSENFEFESKIDKHHPAYSLHHEENIKQEAKHGLKASQNVLPGLESMNENTSSNVESYNQTQTTPCALAYKRRPFIKRKVDSFELNNFEDVKRSREEDLFLSKQEKTPVMYESKEKYLQQQQAHQTPKYRNIEEQVRWC